MNELMKFALLNGLRKFPFFIIIIGKVGDWEVWRVIKRNKQKTVSAKFSVAYVEHILSLIDLLKMDVVSMIESDYLLGDVKLLRCVDLLDLHS